MMIKYDRSHRMRENINKIQINEYSDFSITLYLEVINCNKTF